MGWKEIVSFLVGRVPNPKIVPTLIVSFLVGRDGSKNYYNPAIGALVSFLVWLVGRVPNPKIDYRTNIEHPYSNLSTGGPSTPTEGFDSIGDTNWSVSTLVS